MEHERKLNTYRMVGLMLVIGALTGCATGVDIMSDFDRSTDFGAYNTYNFIEGAGPDTGEYQSFFSQYMVAAITIEMEKRGYTKSDNPDLLVNFNAILQDKTSVTTSPAPMAGASYYGYRGGMYGGWGTSYGYATETHVSEYTQGTFNIDLVDAARNQLVWEAVGIGRVTEDAQENLEESVKLGVPRFFGQYPYVAGTSTPVTTEQ